MRTVVASHNAGTMHSIISTALITKKVGLVLNFAYSEVSLQSQRMIGSQLQCRTQDVS